MKDGEFSFDQLQSEFHSPARLGIATALFTHKRGLSFAELKKSCRLSDGNLSRHLTRLEEALHIEVTKTFVDKTPRTTAVLTNRGRKAYLAYLDNLRTIIEAGTGRGLDPARGVGFS